MRADGAESAATQVVAAPATAPKSKTRARSLSKLRTLLKFSNSSHELGNSLTGSGSEETGSEHGNERFDDEAAPVSEQRHRNISRFKESIKEDFGRCFSRRHTNTEHAKRSESAGIEHYNKDLEPVITPMPYQVVGGAAMSDSAPPSREKSPFGSECSDIQRPASRPGSKPGSTGYLSRIHEAQVGPESFEKIKLIGKGDAGRVYLAREKTSSKLYALKGLLLFVEKYLSVLKIPSLFLRYVFHF